MSLAARVPAALAAVLLTLPAGASPAPFSRTLRHAIPVTAGQTVLLENLAGRLEIVAGNGPEVVVDGTAYAETESLLESLKLDVNGTTAHMTYPIDGPVYYPGDKRTGFLESLSYSSSTVDYQGRRVTVRQGRGSGTLLYADLRLQVPPGVSVEAFQAVGRISARNVGGGVQLKTGSGDIDVSDATGAIALKTGSGDVSVDGGAALKVSTGSGDVAASRLKGDVEIGTGSGDVRLSRAEAGRVSIHTGSGEITLDDVTGSLELRTGSGDVGGRGLRGVESLAVETGSGQVLLVARDAARLTRAEIETGSGDVELSLAGAPAMTLTVSTSSGGVDLDALSDVRYRTRKERRVEADVRGGGVPVRIRTSSGSVVVR